MDQLINQNIFIREKTAEGTKKTIAYKINSYKKEFENEKMNRYNFLLKSQLPCLIDLNIKLCTKGKELKEIYSEISKKVKETISENSFLKESILILKQIDKKAILEITPIIYQGILVYNIKLNGEFKGTFYNEQTNTKEILNKLGLYENYKKGIDFYLVGELKKENSKKLSKELFEINPNIDKNLILEVAKETENKDNVYPILREILSDEELKQTMKCYKYFNYFRYRHRYVNIFKELEKDKITKFLVLKWFKEEFKNPFIVNDPHNFSIVYDMEFKDIEETKKQYIEKLENELKKFWIHFEKKINSALENQKIKIALCKFDFLLNQLYVKAISDDKMKDYTINYNNIDNEIKSIITDFEK